MVTPELHMAAAAVVFREADCLDRWQWQDWLDLYTDECEFWCPAWVDEETLGDDPDRYVSFFYLAGRAALGDRVFRVQSGLTPFVTPLPRTCHVISNLHVTAAGDGRIEASSHWHASTYHRRVTAQLFGFYDHTLVHDGGRWRIARKKITLLNDHLDLPIDFNQI